MGTVSSFLPGWMCRPALAAALLTVVLLGPAHGEGASITSARGDHFWQLGTGCYFGGLHGRFTELDVARFDWLYLCYGNIPATEETTQTLNRLIALNPRLKVVLRIWPIMGLTPHKENRSQATFYDYFYLPGVKEKVLAETRRQIRVVLDHISKPENVVGLTFLEELPDHFSDSAIGRLPDGKSTWAMEVYRKEIEAELGKPFVWNDETRRWWCRKYVQAINEIHREMKEASGGRLVFYYQQTNHMNLDHVSEGTPLSTMNLLPIHLAEIVKPGQCDGIFGYPNNTHLWNQQTLRFAKERGWLFFSQLAHAGTMRLGSWEECLALAKTRVPQNLGFFWYCEGNCARNVWNDDPSIPPGERGSQRLYYVEHTRRILAAEKVGLDVLGRALKPELEFDYNIKDAKPGEFQPVWVQVHNKRDTSWYADPKDAALRDVKVRLIPPAGVDLPVRNSPPAEIALGDIGPDDYRAVLWWAQMKEPSTVSAAKPMRVILTAANCPQVELRSDQPDTTPAGFQPRDLFRSGDTWIEPTYRVEEAFAPVVRIRPVGASAMRPTLTDGADTVTYNGTLHPGEELVLGPGLKARLLPTNLVVSEDLKTLADPAGANGAKAWEKGYHLFNLRVANPARPGARVRVTISGKVAGGAASLVLLSGLNTATKERWSEGFLVNALKEEWTAGAAAELTFPPDVVLDRVMGYRRGDKGIIWYGSVSVAPAEVPAAGLDVSDRLEGKVPGVESGTYTRLTYRDGSAPSQSARVRVQIERPQAQR